MIRNYIDNFDGIDIALSLHATAGYILALNIKNLTPQILETTYPESWWAEYQNHAYAIWDPIVRWGLVSEGVVRWSDLKITKYWSRNDLVMSRAAGFGLKYGVSIAVKSDYGGQRKCLFSGARPDREFEDAEIDLLAKAFQKCVDVVNTKDILTHLEAEYLRKTCLGMSHKEIGREVGMSPEYVKKHLYRAKTVLKAKNVSHAGAIAIQKGLIEMPGTIRW